MQYIKDSYSRKLLILCFMLLCSTIEYFVFYSYLRNAGYWESVNVTCLVDWHSLKCVKISQVVLN